MGDIRTLLAASTESLNKSQSRDPVRFTPSGLPPLSNGDFMMADADDHWEDTFEEDEYVCPVSFPA
jgi:hypothetical protein